MSSETCALDAVGAEFVRDVLPGEIVTITADGRIESDTSMCQPVHKKCIFEYIYGVIYYSVMCRHLFVDLKIYRYYENINEKNNIYSFMDFIVHGMCKCEGGGISCTCI